MLFTRLFVKLADTGGEFNMDIIKSMRPRKELSAQSPQPTVITIGKINFVVNEHFAENGKNIDELMEDLVIDKYRKTS
jgi:hypothetical protein